MRTLHIHLPDDEESRLGPYGIDALDGQLEVVDLFGPSNIENEWNIWQIRKMNGNAENAC